MSKSRVVFALTLAVAGAAFAVPAATGATVSGGTWAIAATVIVALPILAFFFEFESAAIGSKEVALIGMLGTMSAMLRVPFAAIPSVQPSTAIVICTGYVFGPMAGFMVGALTALVSNFFLGHGPWTPYQMLAWGLLGVASAYLRRFHLGRFALICVGIIGGYVYGWIMNSWYWVAFIYPLTLKTFVTYQLTSVWLDTLHAAGNAVILGVFGMKVIGILERFRARFSWRLSTSDDIDGEAPPIIGSSDPSKVSAAP